MSNQPEPGVELLPFRRRFPDLTRWQGLDLSGPDLRRSLDPGHERLMWRALEGGCRTLGDLLSHSEVSVLQWRSVGVTKAAQIAGMLATLEARMPRPSTSPSPADDVPQPWPEAIVEPDRDLERLVRRLHVDFDFDGASVYSSAKQEVRDDGAGAAIAVLCGWAATVGGITNTADALASALNSASLPLDVFDALEELAGCAQERDPFSDLETVLADLGIGDPRSRSILLDRIVAPDPLGLQTLGDMHDVTRERIRQLETRIRGVITTSYPAANSMKVVRWLGHELRERVGAFAPAGAAFKIAPHLDPNLMRLAIYLEGYRCRDGYLVADGFELPDEDALEVDAGVVDLGDLVFQLGERGVKEEFVDSAIAAMRGFEWVGEMLVVATKNFVDRAAIVIDQHGEPIDVEILRGIAAPEASVRGFRQRVFEDERFVRTSRNSVALAVWGHDEYTTLPEAMRDAVKAGPWELDDLAEDLAERFAVSPNSVRMYAAAPMFRVRDGMLELRPTDDPYIPRNALASVSGLFGDPGDGAFRWNVVVDKDILRGSGRAAPPELAAAIGLSPGERVVLACANHAIGFTWPLTSHTGPHVGSLKAVAEVLECKLGDMLNLTVSYLEKTVSAVRIESNEVRQVASFRIMTGVDPDDLDGVQRVVGCTDGLIAALVKRGDGHIAELVAEAMGAK